MNGLETTSAFFMLLAGPWGGVMTAVLPVIGAVAAGAIMRRVNWLTSEADASSDFARWGLS